MRKVENQSGIAAMIKEFYHNQDGNLWQGFEFEEKAELIRTPYIPGPAWMVKARRAGRVVVFIFELVTKYVYIAPSEFAYYSVVEMTDIEDCDGNVGKLVEHNGEKAVVWR